MSCVHCLVSWGEVSESLNFYCLLASVLYMFFHVQVHMVLPLLQYWPCFQTVPVYCQSVPLREAVAIVGSSPLRPACRHSYQQTVKQTTISTWLIQIHMHIFHVQARIYFYLVPTWSCLSLCTPNFPPKPLTASVWDPCLDNSDWWSQPRALWNGMGTASQQSKHAGQRN